MDVYTFYTRVTTFGSNNM